MPNWFNNIFGTTGRTRVPLSTKMDFIPDGFDGDVTKNQDVVWVKGGDASWMGLNTAEMQYWAYCFCSPLSAVIDRLAEADVNGEIMFLKNDGSDDFSNSAVTKRLKKLFKKPNPLQDWYQFRAQQVVFKKVFGFCPVFAMTAAGHDITDTSYLWNLNPYFAKPVSNDKFSLYKDENSIKEWKIKINDKEYTIPADKVFILKDGYLDNAGNELFLPLSKEAGLEWAVSNLCASMEADNVLLRKKGPLGFISHDPKPDNVAGYIPMTKDQKKEIQGELDNYGLSWNQFQYVITKLPIRWNPMSFNVRDLMTKETTRQSIDMICDRYNYPAELMSGKNATYENRNSAEKFMYQNNVIPSSIRDTNQYVIKFEMEENNIKFIQDYSKLPVLQEDIVKAGEAAVNNSQANFILFQNSVITLNEWRIRQEVDTVSGDDIYYAEYLEKYGVKTEVPELKPVPANKKAVA